MTNIISELCSKGIPNELAEDLVTEYTKVKSAYYGQNSEKLYAAVSRFCETVFQILEFATTDGYHKKVRFSDLMRHLESLDRDEYPQSIRVVIPRVANALYTVRSERGDLHKTEVSPTYIDNALAVSLCDWLLAEILRLYHSQEPGVISSVLCELSKKKYPVVEEFEDKGVMLHVPGSSIDDQILAALYGGERLKVSEISRRIRSYPQLVLQRLKRLKRTDRVDINDDGAKISSEGIRHLEERIKQAFPT